MKTFEWVDASSIDEALSLLGDGAVLKAGGIDLMDLMKEHLLAPQRLVNLRAHRRLDRVVDDATDGLKIGPLVTLAQIADDPVVQKRYTALAEAAGHAATPQIRNMATVGGNLLQRPRCWYFRNENFPCRKKGGEVCYAQEGENQYHAIFNNQLCAIVHPSSLAIALVALGASIEIKSAKASRVVKLEEFFTLPSVDLHRENVLTDGELISEIRIPSPASSSRSAFIKQGEKESFDWPIAEVAAVIDRDGQTVKSASLILGAAAPVPHRATDAEAILVGSKLDADSIHKAAEASVKGATPMTNNQYKLQVFPAVVEQVLARLAGGGQ